ncbi:cupin domain-containing protein [Jiangella alba]|uniref:Cupin domain-containing protein n=1 Tax=Jiangella alba TaxID=561176 RepID=A0A1H5HNW9_9ACTN|nr:cupin domain-containing protein [Jiangella alba]SEE29736.1 Cupin domain-containing protein [Jiangella alba]
MSIPASRALETPTGDTVVVKADTETTGGSLTVLEFLVEAKSGPALHTHARDDELWFVLDGEFRFRTGERLTQVSAGGLAFGPRGTPHCFQNVGDAPGRLLVVTTPAGLERFFEQFAALQAPVSAEQLATVAHASGVDFVGPPLGDT